MNPVPLVLNVDDYDANRYLRSGSLRRAGFQVIEAGGGLEALRLIQSRHPDLVVLDVQMPDMDGLEVCRRVREDPEVASTLILHVSATAIDAGAVATGLDNGADGYLTDMATPEVVLATVRSMLRLRRAEQERNEARTRLAQTEDRLARLLMSLRDVVYRVVVAPRLSVEYVSPGITDLTGHTPEEFYANPDLFRTLLLPGDVSRLEDLGDEGEPDQTRLVLRWTIGERVLWTEHRMTLLRSEAGALTAIEGIARDITSQQEIEEELRQTNHLKDEFLATLSHELRTPLNAIVGWSQMLQTRTLPPETIRQGIDAIARNALAQSRLINDVLDVSRIVAGKVRLNPTVFDLHSALEAAVDGVRPAATAKGLELSVSCPADPLPMTGDPDRLQQIFWNLLSNAVKFTPPGGTISVTLSSTADAADATIADTGAGIPQWFLPHIFERFRQLDSSLNRNHSGLGLGLALVKHLVELHGGRVRAESDGEGRGTTFHVHLPLRAEMTVTRTGTSELIPITLAVNESEHASGEPLRGLRILLVDDEPDGRETAAAILRHAGAAVFDTGAATDALDRLDTTPVDLVISDLGMPGVDGLELMRQIRRRPNPSGTDVPAIALTAYGRREDEERAVEVGYQVHLAKPVLPDTLIRSVLRLAGRENAPRTAQKG